MGISRKSDANLDRRTDPLWLALAASLSLVSLSIPRLLEVPANRTTPVLITFCGLFLSGALLGSLRPQRIWRWPVAALVAFIARDLWGLPDVPTADWVVSFFAANGVAYAVQAIPVLVGAYLGAFLIRANLQ